MDKKSNKNIVFKLFFSKEKEHTENTESKISIDIFYELFRLSVSYVLKEKKPFRALRCGFFYGEGSFGTAL